MAQESLASVCWPVQSMSTLAGQAGISQPGNGTTWYQMLGCKSWAKAINYYQTHGPTTKMPNIPRWWHFFQPTNSKKKKTTGANSAPPGRAVFVSLQGTLAFALGFVAAALSSMLTGVIGVVLASEGMLLSSKDVLGSPLFFFWIFVGWCWTLKIHELMSCHDLNLKHVFFFQCHEDSWTMIVSNGFGTKKHLGLGSPNFRLPMICWSCGAGGYLSALCPGQIGRGQTHDVNGPFSNNPTGWSTNVYSMKFREENVGELYIKRIQKMLKLDKIW